ncbi:MULTISPECIES: hypothetical protein [Alicyclobacillus]|uniref:Uncharacterized protein n=3 Tax=Alicyclobacillus tolerans TaxID=90970 RepID=A0ABT9LTK9_9BACL|nr:MULTISPECIES: hypothetical protein [Alicyclobacillus]MDP9727594.1 hypothetical protein [Alicyclobacillus tengchongensis]SHJ65266.1 hypothetical protein SAMN05443507_10278 [Alicyclobacillus montanus]
MYGLRRNRIPRTVWIAPILLIVAFLSAFVVDYINEHVTLHVLTENIDVANVRSILLQPLTSGATAANTLISVSGHNTIVQILKSLSESTPISDNKNVQSAQVFDTLYVESNSQQMLSIQLAVNPTSLQSPYVLANGHAFMASPSLVNILKKLNSNG